MLLPSKIQISLVFFLLPIISNNLIPVNKKQSKEIITLTANDVISRIKEHVTCDWRSETVDTYKAGTPETEVTGIVTTFLATLSVLKQAKEKGCNMVITHEPTFYNHFDDKAPLENDPVQKAKMKFIEDNNMVVFRFHDHWHATQPDGIYKGMIEDFGWEGYKKESDRIFNIPEITANNLAKEIGQKFNTDIIRVVGDPKIKIDKVGLVLGAAGSASHFAMFNEPGIDAVIIGEGREWETVEYVRDANEAGMPKALIIMGHADSEESGMDYCAKWLKGFITEIPVKFIEAGNPLWSPE